MDKKVISTFIAKANSSSIDLLSRAVKETEKELKVALTSNEIMQLVTMTMQFKYQMGQMHVGTCTTMVYKDSLIAPTYAKSSNFLLERIALSLGTIERKRIRGWKETLESGKPVGTTNVVNSINAIGKLKSVNVEEAANKLAKSILAFCEEDLLLAAVILHTNGNVVATGNNIGCSARMSNVIFGINGVYNTALQQVRAELKNTYKDFKEDLNMNKKQIKELIAQNKSFFSKEDIVEINDMLLEGEVEEAEEMVNEIISASTDSAEVQTAAIETVSDIKNTTEEVVSTVTDPLVVEIKEQRKKVARQGNFTEGAEKLDTTATTDAKFAGFENGEVLDAQIKMMRHSQDVAILSKELQSIGTEVEEIALDMERGLHKMKVGDTVYAIRNTEKYLQCTVDAFYKRIGKVLDKPKYCLPKNGWLQPCGEYVSFGAATPVKAVKKATTIQVAQIPSRKERVAKKEVVTTTPEPTVTVAPEPVVTPVVKSAPIQTTAPKGVPTTKNPKGGNGKKNVRIQVRTIKTEDGYTSRALLTMQGSDFKKTLEVTDRYPGNAQWLVLAKALSSIKEDKLNGGKVYLDVPAPFVSYIQSKRSFFETKFRFGKTEALAFADARDSFNKGTIVYRFNSGRGYDTASPFIVHSSSASTRKEVGVAPTVGE